MKLSLKCVLIIIKVSYKIIKIILQIYCNWPHERSN